jgi:asparagine synthase (glutamine-hydrolysing)
MISTLRSDPAYETGEACFVDLGVYAGWIARADSFAAMQSAHRRSDGRALLFAGECLSSPGQSSLFSEAGDLDGKRLEALNGQFSGLFVDPPRRRAVLFNDRYAIERLYVVRDEDATYFSSEAKALLCVIPSARKFDEQGVADFLNFGSVLGGRTLFRSIRCLPGASMWVFGPDASCTQERYFRPATWESQQQLPDGDFEQQFVDVFQSVLPRYLNAPSRVGISVTGGLDTRMIMACLAGHRIDPICYTYAGMTGDLLDARIGAAVARLCGLEHHTLRMGPDFLTEYGRFLDGTVFASDGCAGALAAHEIYYTALARQLSPVRLTGNFGSEVLRSVSTFRALDMDPTFIDPALRPKLNESVDRVRDERVHPVTHAAFREVPWHLFGTLAAARSQVVVRTPFLDDEIVRLAFRASPRARQTPESALRLIRAANPRLAELPTDRGVTLNGMPSNPLRRLYAEVTFKVDYLHKEGLPNWLSPFDGLFDALSAVGLLDRHKFLPYRRWFRNELAPYIRSVLLDSRTGRLPYLNHAALPAVLRDHASGRRNHVREIHAALTLEATQRLLLEMRPDGEGNGYTA